jgi:hypothetical protein
VPITTISVMARKSQKKRAKQHHAANNKEQAERDRNPLLTAQRKFITSLPKEVRSHFFSPTHLTPQQRAQIWEDQADLGEKLVDSYAWATPDSRLLPVLKHFGPIVEIGCGANAYWAKWMHDGGVDVIAFDVSLQQGGKISSGSNKKAQKNDSTNATHAKKGLIIREGGPEMLSDPEIKDSDRALFLCYPDEEDMPPSQPVDDDRKDTSPYRWQQLVSNILLGTQLFTSARCLVTVCLLTKLHGDVVRQMSFWKDCHVNIIAS